jgi:hypothetical protein
MRRTVSAIAALSASLSGSGSGGVDVMQPAMVSAITIMTIRDFAGMRALLMSPPSL